MCREVSTVVLYRIRKVNSNIFELSKRGIVIYVAAGIYGAEAKESAECGQSGRQNSGTVAVVGG